MERIISLFKKITYLKKYLTVLIIIFLLVNSLYLIIESKNRNLYSLDSIIYAAKAVLRPILYPPLEFVGLKEKSDLLFNSLRTLEKLPKNTRVYPNHVGAAHAIDSENTYSTIGNEIETNEAMQIKDSDKFYTYMTEGWPPKPEDWEQIIEDNSNG